MKMSSLGGVQISVTPESNNPEVLNVDIAAQNRKDVVSMKTNKDETVDQFCTRVRSMLRALLNGEPRVKPGEEVEKEKKANATWEEDQKKLTDKSKAK